MAQLWVLLVLGCLAACLPPALPVQPGFQLRVSSRGLSYANQVAVSALSQKLRTLRIPRISGGDRKFSYDVSNLQVTRFTTPSSQISLLPGRGLRWSISNGAVSVRADFRAMKKVWFIRLRPRGIITADASGVSLNVDLQVGKDSGGRPTLRVSSCRAGVGSLKVKISKGGFFTGLYNLLLGAFRGKIRRMLEGQICKSTERFVDGSARRKLGSLPVQLNFLKKFVLDYRLLASPQFTSQYLETRHKGLVYWRGDQREPPFSCPALPSSQSASSMASLWVSECLANSMAYAAHAHNYTRYTLNDLPSAARSFLRTSCGSGVCLGSLFPRIAQRFPNAQAGISLYTTSAPRLDISRGVATVHVAGKAELAVSSSSLFALSLNLTLGLSPSIQQDRLVVRFVRVEPRFSVTLSSVGTLPTSSVQKMLQEIISKQLIPQLNREGAGGMPLPTTGLVHLVSPRLQLLQNALLISTDVRYQP